MRSGLCVIIAVEVGVRNGKSIDVVAVIKESNVRIVECEYK
jgi:hypothetical protein